MTSAEQMAPTMPAPAIKRCSCGSSWTALEWAYLTLIGLQDDGDGGHLELRNCTCGSTIAVEVEG